MSSHTSVSSNFLRCNDGAALVEAALITPLFLLLLFAMFDLGLCLWQWNAANKATQLGVRYAATSNPVAVGPGLTTDLVLLGKPLGASCTLDPATNPCRTFVAICNSAGCGGGYTKDATAFNRIVGEMQRVMPDLQASNVRVTYSSNGLGFVGYPNHVPNDVTVEIINRQYSFIVLSSLLSWLDLPIRASATLSSEDLKT